LIKGAFEGTGVTEASMFTARGDDEVPATGIAGEEGTTAGGVGVTGTEVSSFLTIGLQDDREIGFRALLGIGIPRLV